MKRPIVLFFFSAALALSQDVVPGINKFALKSYRHFASKEGNFVSSPLSIHNALSMALAGARGETSAEMAAVLEQIDPDGKYHEEYAALLASLKDISKEDGDTLLANAAGLWVEQTFVLEPSFLEIMNQHYGAALAQVDFRTDAEGARQAINAWTEEHTRGKISELFAERSLNERTRLVLATAIYFLAKWQLPFDVNRTRQGTFQLADGGTVSGDFMNQTARVGYAETATLQIAELKYADSDVVFDMLLPKSVNGLASLEEELSSENLTAWLSDVQPRMVELMIPKFRVDFGGSISSTLSAMGMPTAFTEGAADFSGIGGQRDLYITDVVHKAFIEVNEAGTEAAAATGISIGVTSLPIVQHTFRSDHPFAFVLRDTKTGVILFAGRVSTTER